MPSKEASRTKQKNARIAAQSAALPQIPKEVLDQIPVPISSRLTHSLSVCGTQPILGAKDSMAAHSER